MSDKAEDSVSEVTGLTQDQKPQVASIEVDSNEQEEEKKGWKEHWRVYLAHTLSAWGDNMWLFAGGIYMVEMDSKSLRLTAIYGLFLSASMVVFGAALGRWIDKTKRLTAARTCLVVQNLSVSVSAILLSVYLFTHPVAENEPKPNNSTEASEYDPWACSAEGGLHSRSLDNPWAVATVALVILFTSISKIASEGSQIILQKDWIVVLTKGNSDGLAAINATLRSIELTTYMLCPLFVGLLLSTVGYELVAVIIACWNLVSVCFEYVLLQIIYKRNPDLANKISIDNNNAAVSPKKRTLNPLKGAAGMVRNAYHGWELYMTHPVRNAGLGLALLYMTVLGFDNITYAYVLNQCIPEFWLGIIVAASAFVGILGSQAFTCVRKRIGLERTGLLGMFLLVSTSSLSVAAMFLPGSKWSAFYPVPDHSMISAITLLCSITAARFGLWMTDLTITQILQERVEEERRGVINGVQDSLNSSMDLLKCVLVIVLPGYHVFGWLVILSFGAISCGWLSYALYSRKQRGHLFHFCRLVQVLQPGEIHRVPTTGDEEDEKKKQTDIPLV